MEKNFNVIQALPGYFWVDSEGYIRKLLGYIVTPNEMGDSFDTYAVSAEGFVYGPVLDDGGMAIERVYKNSILYDDLTKRCNENFGETVEEMCGRVGCPIVDYPKFETKPLRFDSPFFLGGQIDKTKIK